MLRYICPPSFTTWCHWLKIKQKIKCISTHVLIDYRYQRYYQSRYDYIHYLVMRRDDNCDRLQVRIYNDVFVHCNERLMEITTAIRPAGRPNSGLERHPSLTNLFGRWMKPQARASVTQNYRLFFFSWRYTTHSGCVFYSPLSGFSLLAYKVTWSHTATRHSR